jgi:DNA-binding transcriptional regulator YiaG
MTEEDVQAAAFADSDNSPLTEEQFTQFEGAPKGKAIREKLHLTQQQFTDISGLSLSVVRDWEQGRFVPDRAARTLLKVMARNPKAVKKALPRSQRVVNDDASASPCYS